MKKRNPNLFGLIILMTLLAGCFNPVTIAPPINSSVARSFTIDIMIGSESKIPMDELEAEFGRTIAGPELTQIRGNGYNFIQLFAVNEAGQIVSFDEARRGSDDEKTAELWVNSLSLNKMYYFFLLMGHWEHDGNYNYKTNLPTLLAAGLQEKMITANGKITVTMWPIIVDTKFTSVDGGVPEGSRKKEPLLKEGNPKNLTLHKGNWTVNWTINRESEKGSGSGLVDLIRAQQIISPGTKDKLQLKSMRTILRGTGLSDDVQSYAGAETGNVITLDMGIYTAGSDRKGMTGSVAFNLEYIPFNIRAAAQSNPWRTFNSNSVFDLSGDNEPVWIIRNGVNDLPQNSLTNFNAPQGKKGNWNGAISFNIPETGSIVIPIPW
jgi:hypothetical protein